MKFWLAALLCVCIVGCDVSREAKYQKALTLYNTESEILDRLYAEKARVESARDDGIAEYNKIVQDAEASPLRDNAKAMDDIYRRREKNVAEAHAQAKPLLDKLTQQITEQEAITAKAKANADKLRD